MITTVYFLFQSGPDEFSCFFSLTVPLHSTVMKHKIESHVDVYTQILYLGGSFLWSEFTMFPGVPAFSGLETSLSAFTTLCLSWISITRKKHSVCRILKLVQNTLPKEMHFNLSGRKPSDNLSRTYL